MNEYLWNYCYDSHNKKFYHLDNIPNTITNSNICFSKFILETLRKVYTTCLSNDLAGVTKILKAINVTLNNDESSSSDKRLAKKILSKWLPLSQKIMDTTVLFLPSPVVAQNRILNKLYSGDLSDKVRKKNEKFSD